MYNVQRTIQMFIIYTAQRISMFIIHAVQSIIRMLILYIVQHMIRILIMCTVQLINQDVHNTYCSAHKYVRNANRSAHNVDIHHESVPSQVSAVQKDLK